MVARLAGAEFFDASGRLSHAEFGGGLMPGESIQLLLEFEEHFADTLRLPTACLRDNQSRAAVQYGSARFGARRQSVSI